MQNIILIQDNLKNLVGWRNNTLPNFNLDADNIKSESGLYYNDANTLVTLENIKDTTKPTEKSELEFNEMLKTFSKSVINSVVLDIFSTKNGCLINLPSTLSSKEITQDKKAGQKIGFVLETPTTQGMNLNQVSFLSENAETFELKLYKEYSQVAVKSWDVTLQPNEKLDLFLNHYISGRHYLIVEEDSLDSTILELENSFVSSAFGGAEFVAGDHIENLTASQSKLFTVSYSIYNDYTNFIIQNKIFFANAVQLAMTKKILEAIITTTRSNLVQRQNVDIVSIAYEMLNGTEENKESINVNYKRAIDEINRTLFDKRKIYKTTIG